MKDDDSAGTGTVDDWLDDQVEHKATSGKPKGTVKEKMKQTPDDRLVTERAYEVVTRELTSIVEGLESLAAQKADIARFVKERMDEAKARGYNGKAIKAVLKLRQMTPDERAESDNLIALYRRATGC